MDRHVYCVSVYTLVAQPYSAMILGAVFSSVGVAI